MHGYFCIGFIDFTLNGKSWLECSNLFSPEQYKKNEKIILKYFQQSLNTLKCWKSIVMFAINIKNLKTVKYQIFVSRF